MRSTGWTERALGAGIAVALFAGLGAVAVHEDGDNGRGTAAGAVARRPSTSTTNGLEPLGTPPGVDATDAATGTGNGSTGSRTTRRTSSAFAHAFSTSNAPLPPDTLAPPPAEEPAPPPPPPSDDVANELIAGVLDLVDVDPGSGIPAPG